MPALYTISQAAQVAVGLTATDLDNWTYAVSDNGNGTAYIGVYDDLGDFVDYLDLHLVATHQDTTTRCAAWKRNELGALPETSRQCEKRIVDFNPWVRESTTPRQCKRRATIGARHCFQHGGGRCYCH